MIECNGTIQRAPELIGAESADETILVNLQNGRFFGLGASGAAIWQFLENPCTAEEITARLSVAFDVKPELIRPDIEQFLVSLAAEGLIVNTNRNNATAAAAAAPVQPLGSYVPPRLDAGTLRHAANGSGNGSDGGFGTTSGLS